MNSKKSSMLVFSNHHRSVVTQRSTLRERYQVSEAEYKRFTLMKINSTVIGTRYPTRGESFFSFTRPEYVYRGKSLKHLVSAAKKSGDALGGTSNLLQHKKADKAYKDVLALVHKLYVEYTEELETVPRPKLDEFSVKVMLKIPLDLFMFRLIR